MYLSFAFDFTRVLVHSLQLIDSGHYLYASTTISTLLTQVPSRTANENGKDQFFEPQSHLITRLTVSLLH